MISRVADQCFWFGRYVERAESTARLLFVTLNLSLDAELQPEQCWRPALIASGEEQAFVSRFGEERTGDGERVQDYMTWGEDNLCSIRRSVAAARENARSIREVLSLEVWETINELHLYLGSDAAEGEFMDHRYGFYRHVRASTQLALGLLRSTMLHDTAMDFIWLGVLLERAGQTARTLDVHHYALTELREKSPVLETSVWLTILRACSGFEPYMKRFRGRVSGRSVAAFLTLEPRFPRSVAYCVHSGYERLCAIRPPEQPALPGARALARLGALDALLRNREPDTLEPDQVHPLLIHVVDETAAVCNDLAAELLGAPGVDPSAQLQQQIQI